MKHYSRLKTMLVASVAALTLSSCLDTDDPEFAIYAYTGFVYQESTKLGEDDYSHRFAPYFRIGGDGNYTISDLQGQGGPMGLVTMTPVEGSYNLMYESSEILSSTYPEGTYTFTATSAEGEVAQCQVTLTEGDTLGYINVTELKYENGKITAKFDEVKNADVYLVGLRNPDGILPVYSEEEQTYPASGIEFELTDSEKEALGNDTYELFVGAYAIGGTTNQQYVQVFAASERTESVRIN